MTKDPTRALILSSGLGFIAWAGASILLSGVSYDKSFAAINLAALGLAFCLGWWSRSILLAPIILVGLTSANSLIALSHWWLGESFGFEGYPGWMGNPNIFGCFLVVSLAAALSYRLWSFLPFLAIGFCLIRSRGAILATGVTLAIWFWPRYKVCSFASLIFSIVIAIEISSGGGESGLSEAARELGSAWVGREIGIMARLGIWQDTINHLTLQGAGFGSFFEAYNTWMIHTNMTLMRASHVYNDFLELIFELGLGAIPLWILLIVGLSQESQARLVCLAFFALALTYSPLTLPILGQTFAFFLGQASKGTTYGALEAYDRALPQGSWN